MAFSVASGGSGRRMVPNMDDETPRLRALLEELHGELSRLSSSGVDEERRAQLLDLKADIERLLARRDAAVDSGGVETPVPPEERKHLQGRLQELVASFEGAHPQIASALEQTMNALSNMGL